MYDTAVYLIQLHFKALEIALIPSFRVLVHLRGFSWKILYCTQILSHRNCFDYSTWRILEIELGPHSKKPQLFSWKDKERKWKIRWKIRQNMTRSMFSSVFRVFNRGWNFLMYHTCLQYFSSHYANVERIFYNTLTFMLRNQRN